MDLLLVALLMGIIEGVTEFLPISSTGHLILANHLLSLPEHFDVLFMIVIQLGAILSVVFHFQDKLIPWRKNTDESSAIFNLWKKTIVGVLPAILIGGTIGGHIEEWLFKPWIVATMLFFGGIVLVVIEKTPRKATITNMATLSYRIAIVIGIIQCLAIVPGVSRSAATIIGALLLGCSRVVAVEFSFFLAIPTMVAASIYELFFSSVNLNMKEWLIVFVGFLMSFIVALIAIRFLMHYAKYKDFQLFGYYRIGLAILIITFLSL